MGRKNMLDVAVPLIRQHMAEKDVALTGGEIAELLGVSSSAASNVLAYMEALGIVQRVGRRRIFYFLKGAYDEERLSEILLEAGARPSVRPRRGRRTPQKSKYDPILDRFLESGHRLVEVTVEGKPADYVKQILDRRIEGRGLGGKVGTSVVDEYIYLEKINYHN